MPVAYNRVKLAKKKRNAFLRELFLNGGMVIPAAKAVGYVNPQPLYHYRKQNEEFAEAWDEVIEMAGDLVEAEVYRRAIHGVKEPVFYKGEIVGYVNKFSDRLAELLLKRHKPEYRETGREGGVNINVGVAVMPSAAKSLEDWQARTIKVHAEQVPIQLEDKPKENLLQKNTIKRGD